MKHFMQWRSLKPGSFGYSGQAALALIGPIQDTMVESTIFDSTCLSDLQIMRDELDNCMALSGCTSVDDIVRRNLIIRPNPQNIYSNL